MHSVLVSPMTNSMSAWSYVLEGSKPMSTSEVPSDCVGSSPTAIRVGGCLTNPRAARRVKGHWRRSNVWSTPGPPACAGYR